jgi:hypothetical protein
MVVILERWAESMLVLKKLGGWDSIDVASIRLNKNNGYKAFDVELGRTVKGAVALDYRVYQLASARLDELHALYYPVQSAFDADLKEFNRINAAVMYYLAEQEQVGQQQAMQHPSACHDALSVYKASPQRDFYLGGDTDLEQASGLQV